jgi:aryl-alcohol dehydrogenase-like predicted oxidoreductase
MQYTRLGNTGLIVSKLAFGAMTFGDDASNQQLIDPTHKEIFSASAN